MPQRSENHMGIHWNGFTLQINRKPIRHVYLRVCPQTGEILISAPFRISDENILKIITHKAAWLRKQQQAISKRCKPAELHYSTGERHLFLGREYPLTVRNCSGAGRVEVSSAGGIEIFAPPGASRDYLKNMILRWYRKELISIAEPMRLKWQEKMGVYASELRIRKMRTRWGSCNTQKKRIWLNLELAKKNPNCIEYVMVHELAHLIERGHTKTFWAVVEMHLPNWRQLRMQLNTESPTGF